MIERNSLTNHYIPTLNKNFTAAQLLDILEEICTDRNSPPTGLTYLTLPNVERLLTAIKDLDLDDTYSDFAKKVSVAETVERSINPKYFLFLE